jgi:UPF0042 nucleotide-binding protein
MASQNDSTSSLHVTVFSFGYKYGPPKDVNLLLDVRFLPNPYWVESLRQRTGREKDVADYAIGNTVGREFLHLIEPLLIFFVEQQNLAQKGNLTIAVGCTGGRHRSVAVVEALRAILAKQPVEQFVYHRDIEKE